MSPSLSLRILVVVAAGTLLGVAAFRANLVAPTSAAEVEPPPPLPVAKVAPPPSTTIPVPTTEPRPRRGWLTVHGVGDTNFDPDYIPRFRSAGYASAFDGLRGMFESDGLTIVNLECTPSDLGSALAKEFTFRCDPAALPIARRQGVDVANLGNNHSQDFGTEAMLDGRANLLAAGIAPVGAGANLGQATAPALFEIEGWKVAVVGMGGVVPSERWLADEIRPGMASGDDIEQMTTAVRAAADLADLVFVTIHWGVELESEPEADDRERAEALIAAGADAVFGHHPHRLGGLEFVDGKPVFWTLGNFIWPRLSDAGATTAIGRVVVSPTGMIDACLIPAFIQQSGQPVVTGPAECGPDSSDHAVAQR